MNPVWSKWYTWTWSVSSHLIGQSNKMLASDWLRGGWELATACIREEHYYNIHPMPTFCWSVSLSKLLPKNIQHTFWSNSLTTDKNIFIHKSFFLFPRITRLNGLDCIIRLWSMAYGFEIILIKFTHGIIRSLELSLILVRQSRFVMNE